MARTGETLEDPRAPRGMTRSSALRPGESDSLPRGRLWLPVRHKVIHLSLSNSRQFRRTVNGPAFSGGLRITNLWPFEMLAYSSTW